MLRKVFRQYYPYGNCIVRQVNWNRPFFCTLSVRRCSQNPFHDEASEFEDKKITDSVPKFENYLKPHTSVLERASQDISSVIKSFRNVEDILYFLKTKPKIDVSFYAPIFGAIFHLQKARRTNIKIEELTKRAELEYLALQVKKKVRFLNASDALVIFKVLHFLRVPADSVLSQHLLQIISKNVNRLTIPEIIFLQFLLHKSSSNHLVEGLKIALPIVFNTNIRFQLDRQDPEAVSQAMRFVANERTVPNDTFEFLVETAFEIKEKFNCGNAYTAITAMFDVRLSDNLQLDLYKHLMKTVVDNMYDCLTVKQINYLARGTITMFIHVDTKYYSEDVMSKATDYMITRKVDIEEIGKLLRNCDRISYPSYKLVDYVDEVLVSFDNFDDMKTTMPIFAFLANCSNCTYKPKYWDIYENKIIEYIEKHKTEYLPLVKAVTDLIVLKCWPTSLIKFCFSEDYLRNHLNEVPNELNYVAWLTLYQAVQSLSPGGYNQNSPPEDIIKLATDIVGSDKLHPSFPLQGALAHAFGGYKYVLTGVRTRLGHFIDHLIVKRKSGQMYVINENENKNSCQQLIENLDIPEESFLIAVLLFNPSAYCLDGMKIRGKTKLLLHSMEALGILTIPISRYAWTGLSDRDKIPYLINKIQSRTPATVSHMEGYP